MLARSRTRSSEGLPAVRAPIWSGNRPTVDERGLDTPAHAYRRRRPDQPDLERVSGSVRSQSDRRDQPEADAADAEHHESAHEDPPELPSAFLVPTHHCKRPARASVPSGERLTV